MCFQGLVVCGTQKKQFSNKATKQQSNKTTKQQNTRSLLPNNNQHLLLHKLGKPSSTIILVLG
jgi:hypothetical protein